MSDLPSHPEDFEFAALLRHRDLKQSRWVVVPHGQSLDFDEGSATRRWLAPHLGSEWYLFGFVPLHPTYANARLIAAAPELLRALQELVEAYEGSDRFKERALKALAKAGAA